MSQADIELRVRRSTDRFLADLQALVAQAARAAVHEALSASIGASPAASTPSESPTPAKRKSPSRNDKPSVAAQELGDRRKRTKREVEELTDMLLEYIERHPGQRMEEISAGLGVPSIELTLPMRNLARENHLRMVGQKRATAYYAR
jgi:hypothetical protein